MNSMTDYHMHTPLCRHAEGEPTEYARHAVSVGLKEIGFSDHSPMPQDDFDQWRMRLDQLDEYVEKVKQARENFPDLAIRLGLEVDYLPGYENWIRDLARHHPWDYFIGSVHYLSDHWDLDNPQKLSEWRSRDTKEVWSAYFERLAQAIRTGLFDIVGHADLCKKFKFIPNMDCIPLYRKVVDAAAETGTVVEINTAGLRKECREMYPHPDFLKLALDAGVGLVFGSDAHKPSEVGMNFSEALQLAQECGFKEAVSFVQRKKETYALPEGKPVQATSCDFGKKAAEGSQ